MCVGVILKSVEILYNVSRWGNLQNYLLFINYLLLLSF